MSSHPSDSKSLSFKTWNLPGLCTVLTTVTVLLYALFSNLEHNIFSGIDIYAFRFLNGFVEKSPFWQNFWAMANHRWADWLEDVCLVYFFYALIKSTPKPDKAKKIAECLFILFYSVLVILLANEVLFRAFLHIKRQSPTLVVNSFNHLAEKVTWLKVKCQSAKSFPGDHATTALLFLSGFFYLARDNPKIRISAFFYGVFLSLPRLVTGAHWLSDVLIGSGSIVAVFFSLAFHTPFASFCLKKLERLTTFSTKKRDSVQAG